MDEWENKEKTTLTVPTMREKGTSSGFDLIVVLTFKIHFDIRLQTLC